MNEPDSFALEEALRLKEKHGGEVVALSMGPERAKQTIKEALAKGADRGIHVADDKFFLLDPLGAAKSLAAALQKENFDLILTGLQSDDQGFGQTGVLLAELLGLPHATIIMQIEVQGRPLRLKRELEAGWFQWVELPLPAVLTIQSGINKVRYASLKGHHGGEEKRDCRHLARIAGRGARADRARRAHLRAAKNQEDRIHHRHAEGSRGQADRKIAPRSARFIGATRRRYEHSGHHRAARRQVESRQLRDSGRGAANAAAQTGSRLAAAVIGKGVRALADELAANQLAEVLLVEHDLLDRYTPDGFTIALAPGHRPSQARSGPLAAHLSGARFAPKLAASLGKGMIGDCIGYRYENGRADFRAPDVSGQNRRGRHRLPARAPWFASFQAGAFRGDQVARGAAPAPVTPVAVDLKPEQIRTKPLELFREAKQAVDLTQAPILVAVGRGIKAPENIPMAEKLAKLLGGELARRAPSATKAGCPWTARSAAPARPSRPSSISRSASAAPFSTSWA